MKIATDFDSGSIKVIALKKSNDIQLELLPDNLSDDSQWFHFKLSTSKGKTHRIRILNAGDSRFSLAWQDYRAMASYDKEHWFRVPTQFDGKELEISHTPSSDNINYAYFTPYDYERHQRLIHWASSHSQCQHSNLGQSPDGHNMDLLTLGKESTAKHKIWLIARQHPGETMAQWFVEGLLKRLLSKDTISNKLMDNCVFYIVPNMNPDGGIRGNHRTNSQGINLNRHWDKASIHQSPEVFYVRKAMDEKGVDLFLDIHGDEEIPYNFLMAPEDNELLNKEAEGFKRNFAKASEDFQFKYDYRNYHSGYQGCCTGCNKNLSQASSYVQDKFGCLSMILEMPFIDNANEPNETFGWSATRSAALGAAIIEPILTHIDNP